MNGLSTSVIAQGVAAAVVGRMFPWYRHAVEREVERAHLRCQLMALGLTNTEIAMLEQQGFDLQLIYDAVLHGEISAIRVKLNEAK